MPLKPGDAGIFLHKPALAAGHKPGSLPKLTHRSTALENCTWLSGVAKSGFGEVTPEL